MTRQRSPLHIKMSQPIDQHTLRQSTPHHTSTTPQTRRTTWHSRNHKTISHPRQRAFTWPHGVNRSRSFSTHPLLALLRKKSSFPFSVCSYPRVVHLAFLAPSSCLVSIQRPVKGLVVALCGISWIRHVSCTPRMVSTFGWHAVCTSRPSWS